MKKLIALACLLWLTPLIVSNMTANISLGGMATAAEEKKKTRRVPAMREATYKRLAEAQIMIDPESTPREEGEPAPEPKGTPHDAIVLLLKLKDRRGLNSYELAQVWNTLAFAYYTVEDVPNTIRSYENVLLQGAITEALEQTALRSLFQLYYSQEQYLKSIEFMDKWETLRGKPDAGVTFIKSTAYYQLNRFRDALKNALLVEQIALQNQKKIKENWWYLQVVLYNELEESDNVIGVLEKLIVNYPKKQYWMHIAGMYDEKNMDDQALSAYHAVYLQGMMTKESELVMLAQRMLNAEVPYESSVILEKGLKSKVVERSEKNLKLLATSYTMAQEMSKAIDAWRAATKITEDAELHYHLAQALANEDRHEEASAAYGDAVKIGKLKKLGDVHFWHGISLMQLERWDKAIKAFRASAKADKKKAKQVRKYVRYINGEKRRQKELRKMLAGE